MKKILFLAALSFSLCAEEQVSTLSDADAKKVFEASFVTSEWFNEMMNRLSDMFTASKGTSLSKEELSNVMKEEFFKNEQAHLEFIKTKVKPQDLETLLEVLNNPNYIRVRSTIDELNNCMTCVYPKAMEAIAENPQSIPLPVESLFPIKEVGVTDFEDAISASKYVILDVYADWCGPCKMLAPKLQTLNDELHEKYTFLKLNANENNQELAGQLNIKALPTLIFYKDGKEVARKTGNMDIDALKAVIEATFDQ